MKLRVMNYFTHDSRALGQVAKFCPCHRRNVSSEWRQQVLSRRHKRMSVEGKQWDFNPEAAH